ncbi:hypothetical protein CSOJ01_07442 [Colletotrichum sojae]|uniref:Uncharacterized protein n=1 Tax=Colletotrichum sojae TaxID=2175907 RepID=A0A8H6J8S4_9PEZI|nr:hypothetical protein CSOJ01_07442 [Colletotrichum sojae]
MAFLTTPATTPTSTAQPHAALTTPFIYPPHCSALPNVERHLLSSRSSEATTTATLLVPDPSNPAVVPCHPSGWNRPEARENFAFSGAVCPSNWEATRAGTWFTFTTADYTLDVSKPWSLMTDNAACYRTQRDSDGPWTGMDRWFNTTSVFSGRTEVWDVHAAWHVTWAPSDVSTLSPRPPEATEPVFTWTAETTTTAATTEWTPSATPTRYPPGYKGLTEFFLLVVGLPLLIVSLFVAMCVWACCCGGKGRKKRDDDVPLESVKREQSSG